MIVWRLSHVPISLSLDGCFCIVSTSFGRNRLAPRPSFEEYLNNNPRNPARLSSCKSEASRGLGLRSGCPEAIFV